MGKIRDFASYVSISAGMALAASSFTMLAALFGVASSPVALLAIPVAGALTTIVAGSVGALASRFPSAPGVGVYLGKAFGSRVSLIVVLIYISILGCLAGGESYLFAKVLDSVVSSRVPASLEAVGILFGVVLINLCGLEVPLRFQIWTTLALIATVFALSISPLALGGAHPAPSPSLPGPETGLFGAVSAIGMGVFLFMGFEWVTPLGRSPKHYQRLIPWAMPVAIALLVVAYGTFAVALVERHSAPEISGTTTPAFLLASSIPAPLGQGLALAMCGLAMVNTFNAGLVGASRLVYGLAREGSLPSWCAQISLRTGVPFLAVLLAGGVALSASVVITRFQLTVAAAAYAAAVECFVYGAVVFASLKLDKAPARAGAFRSPFPVLTQWLVGLLMPVLGVAALFADPVHWRFSVAFFAVALCSAVALGCWLDARKRRNSAVELDRASLEFALVATENAPSRGNP